MRVLGSCGQRRAAPQGKRKDHDRDQRNAPHGSSARLATEWAASACALCIRSADAPQYIRCTYSSAKYSRMVAAAYRFAWAETHSACIEGGRLARYLGFHPSGFPRPRLAHQRTVTPRPLTKALLGRADRPRRVRGPPRRLVYADQGQGQEHARYEHAVSLTFR